MASQTIPVGQGDPALAIPEACADLCAEFAKPQFMTTTNGPASIAGMQRYTVEFTFVGERGTAGGAEARQRRDDLHNAFRKLAALTAPAIEPNCPACGSSLHGVE